MIPRTILYVASALALAVSAMASSGCGQREAVASGNSRSTGRPLAATQVLSPGSFAALDVDKDGGIAMWEAQADPSLAARFGELDRNCDGKLDRSEYRAGPSGDLRAVDG